MQLWKDGKRGPRIGDLVYWKKEKCLVKIISRETMSDGVHLVVERDGKKYDILNPYFTRRDNIE